MPLFGLSSKDVEKMEAKRDVKGLFKALSYKDSSVRLAAVEALKKIDDALIRSEVWSELDSRSLNEGLQVVDALLAIGGQRALKLGFTHAFDNPHLKVRLQAVDAFRTIGGREGTTGLFMALDKDDSEVRMSAFNALKNLGEKQYAIAGLRYALRCKKDPNVRKLAAEALVEISDATVVNGLTADLADEDANVRSAAAEALARINAARKVAGAVASVAEAPQGQVICDGCGKEMPSSLVYCSNCGKKLEGKAAPEASTSSNVSRSDEGQVVCDGCGKAMSSSLEYCSNCGKKRTNVTPEESTPIKASRPDENAQHRGEQARKETSVGSPQPAANLKLTEISYKKGSFIGQRYKVQRELGHGGFGIVYLATLYDGGPIFALKTFRDEYLADAETRELFRKEASIWVELERHPYIVQAFFVDEVAGRLYIAMEYIAPNEMGLNSLEGYLERQPPDLAQSLRWAIQFCYGMEHAYSEGIRCHRDIKPANIMINADKTVKITDFGLASVLDPARATSGIKVSTQEGKDGFSTMEGKSAGTPTHMSPEQFTNAATCDQRSDIYSFGIVLYQMATGGKLPFLASRIEELCQLHSQGQVPRLDSPLFSIIQRCLEKRPERRYQSFEELRAGLESLLKLQTGEVIRLPELNETSVSSLLLKTVSLSSLGRFEEAMRCCDKVLEINPQSVDAWLNKGHCFIDLGRYDEAIKCCDKALEIDSQSVNGWLYKGNALSKLGRVDDAISCYDKVLAINPQHGIAWANKGSVLNGLGRVEEAIECCDKALKLDPQDPWAWNWKGVSLTKLGRFEEAIQCHDRALETNPRDNMAWFNKAYAQDQLGLTRDVIVSYRKYIEVAPAKEAKYIELARQRLRTLEGISFNNRDHVDKAEQWINRGSSLANLGRYDEAIKCYDKALEINPQHVMAWLRKGVAADSLGLERNAAAAYRKFIEIAPASEYAKGIELARQRLRTLEGS